MRPGEPVDGRSTGRVRDYRWQLEEPAYCLQGMSAAKKPQVRRGGELAEVERVVVEDEWVGPEQRRRLLRQIRALSRYYQSRTQQPMGLNL